MGDWGRGQPGGVRYTGSQINVRAKSMSRLEESGSVGCVECGWEKSLLTVAYDDVMICYEQDIHK